MSQPKKQSASDSAAPEFDHTNAVALTQSWLRIPSVTAIDAKDYPASQACLGMLADAAARTGARVEWLRFEGGHAKWSYPVDNLYIEWTFGAGEKHLCYMGHLDVVPPGDAEKWRADPYSAHIENGYLYGRGTTDMKGSVAAFFASVSANLEQLVSSTNLRVGMIVTMDEEWAAVNGSRKVLEWMAAQNMRPDAFIVGEPSSQDRLGTHIKIGRRGSLCGTLQIKGTQGHAAYLGAFENPNRALALAVTILNAYRFNDGGADFPSTNFEAIAVRSGDFNASAVVPGHAEILWNVRYTPDHTPDSLEALVMSLIESPPDWAKAHPDVEMLKNVQVVANKDTASLPYRSTRAELCRTACAAVESILGLTPEIDGSGGTTDGRFAAAIFPQAEIIELGLPERGGIVGQDKPDDYLTRGGMHQIDERASVQDIENLQRIFGKILVTYDRRNP